jgi:hydrogenase maturation protease
MTTVIGIGNLDRGDDAAGLAVARLLREKLAAARTGQDANAPCVTVLDLDGDQLALLDAWGDDHDVRVVDATCSDATPGTVCRFDGAGPVNPRFQHRGTHTFSLADVIELARALGRLPGHLTGYGIEGKSFQTGDPMSAEVQAAVTEVTDEILHELKAGG